MPAIAKVTVDRFRDLRGRFARATSPTAVEHSRSHIERAAQMIAQAMAQEAPRGKPDPLGRPRPPWHIPLKEGIRAEVRQQGSRGWTISIKAPRHAKFVIGGTRPHRIPKGGSAEQMAKGYPLHFFWKGQERWFWSVWHPGTKPNRFDLRAVRKVRERALAEARRGARQAFIEPLAQFWRA